MDTGAEDLGWGYSDPGAVDLWAGDTPTSGYNPGLLSSPAPAPGNSSGGWLSGITNLGSAVVNIIRAVDPPKPGTQVYNPVTGLPYGINPQTGLPVAAAQTQSLVVLVVFGIIIIWALKEFL